MQRIITIILIMIVLTLTGCSPDSASLTSSPRSSLDVDSLVNRSKDDALTICKAELKSYASEAEVTRKMTTYVYNKDGYVTKTVCVEENKLINGDMEDLKAYEQTVNLTFNSEIFKVEGFTFSTKLSGETFTLTTAYDYTKINIKEALESGKELYHVRDVIDENFKVPYDKLIKEYADMGFTCEEEK